MLATLIQVLLVAGGGRAGAALAAELALRPGLAVTALAPRLARERLGRGCAHHVVVLVRPDGPTLAAAAAAGPPFIVVAGPGGQRELLAMRAGAAAVLSPACGAEALQLAVERAARRPASAHPDLERLRRHTLNVSARLDQRELLQTVVAEATALLRARGGGVYTYEPAADQLRLVYDSSGVAGLVGSRLRPGEGMAGQLFERPSMVVENYRAWPGRAPAYGANCPFEAVVAVPLRWADRLVGVLYIEDALGRAFTPEDVHLLCLFADHAAVAALNAEKLRRLERLARASSEIMGGLDRQGFPERLQLIARHAAALLDAESSSILLAVGPARAELRLCASHGHPPDALLHERRFAVADGPRCGLTGYIAFHRRTFRAHGEDLRAHVAVRGDLAPHTSSGRCYSLLAQPLLGKDGELVGLIRVDNKRDYRGRSGPELSFSEDDAWLLRLLADAVVSTIESYNLLARWEQLVDSAPSSVIVNDRAGRITTFSKQAERILGYRAERIEFDVRRVYAQQETAGLVRSRLERAGEALADYDTALRDVAGARIPIRLTAAPLYDVMQEHVGTIGHFEDLRELRRVERRLLRVSSMLYRIGEGLQRLPDGAVFPQLLLECAIAPSGLGFSRAVLLRHDPAAQALEVFLAAEHGRPGAQPRDWEFDLARDGGAFDGVVAHLQRGERPAYRLEACLRGLRFPAGDPAEDPLARCLARGQSCVLRGHELARLGAALRDHLDPAEDLAVVPLAWGDGQEGLLLADKKFGRPQIHDEEHDLLRLLASLARMALLARANARLVSDAAEAHRQITTLFGAGRALVGLRDPQQILQEIVQQITDFCRASWSSLLLTDDQGDTIWVREQVSSRAEPEGPPERLRPEGVTARVLRGGRPRIFEDTARHRGELADSIYARGLRSAACFPFVLEGRSLGVMWIHWERPYRLGAGEEEAIELYIELAAGAYNTRLRLEALAHMREEVARAETAAAAAARVADYACELLGARWAVLWWYDEGGGRFLLDRSAASGLPDELARELWRSTPRPGGTAYRLLERAYFAVGDLAGPHDLGPRTADLLRRLGAGAVQGVALRLDGERLGVVYAIYDGPRDFRRDDREQARLFGEYAGRALRRAALLEQVHTARNAAGTIAAASAGGNLARTLAQIAETMQQTLGCHVVTLYPYHAGRDMLSAEPLVAGCERRERVGQRAGPITNALVRRALDRAEALWLDDIADDPELAASRFAREERVVSCAVIPLSIGAETVGVLFASYRLPRRFSADDRTNFGLFANQAAVAIRYDQLLQERDRLLELITAMGPREADGTGRDSLKQTLARVAQQAHDLINPRSRRRCFSHVALKKGNHLHIEAAYPPERLAELKPKVGPIDLAGPPAAPLPAGPAGLVADLRRLFAGAPQEPAAGAPATLVVALVVGGAAIGAIHLEHPDESAFSEQDRIALDTLARYAALAIEHARLYDRLETVAHIVSQMAEGRDLGDVVSLACKGVGQYMHAYASVALANDQGQLEFNPAWNGVFSPHASDGTPVGVLLQSVADGICGWVARHRRPYRADDVDRDPLYIALGDKVFGKPRSELCVPIVYEDRLVGVLDVQSERPHNFDDHDLAFLELLANHLALTVHKERQHALLAANERRAWAYIAGSAWWHSIFREVNVIAQHAELLQQELAMEPTADGEAAIRESVAAIFASAQRARSQKQLPPPLGDPEHLQRVGLNGLIEERIAQIAAFPAYSDQRLRLALELGPEELFVTADPEWLSVALDMLIANAERATRCREARHIVIGTRRHDGAAAIEVRDNGDGVPEELRERLFREPMQASGGGRLGLGTTIVRSVVETYRGTVRLARNGPPETAIVIELPLAS